jgi:hypothetical protein
MFNIDLKNNQFKLDLNSHCQTNFIQTFNSIDVNCDNQFVVSDEGMLCVLGRN